MRADQVYVRSNFEVRDRGRDQPHGVEGLLILSPGLCGNEALIVEHDTLPPDRELGVAEARILELQPIELDILRIRNAGILGAAIGGAVVALVDRQQPLGLGKRGKIAPFGLEADPEPGRQGVRVLGDAILMDILLADPDIIFGLQDRAVIGKCRRCGNERKQRRETVDFHVPLPSRARRAGCRGTGPRQARHHR